MFAAFSSQGTTSYLKIQWLEFLGDSSLVLLPAESTRRHPLRLDSCYRKLLTYFSVRFLKGSFEQIFFTLQQLLSGQTVSKLAWRWKNESLLQ